MKKILLVAAVVLAFVACQRDPHFITDKKYRDEVHADFEVRNSQFSIKA